MSSLREHREAVVRGDVHDGAEEVMAADDAVIAEFTLKGTPLGLAG